MLDNSSALDYLDGFVITKFSSIRSLESIRLEIWLAKVWLNMLGLSGVEHPIWLMRLPRKLMKSFFFVEFDSYWGFILLFAPMVVLELHDSTSYLGCVSLCDKFITLLGSVRLGSFFDLCSFSFHVKFVFLCAQKEKKKKEYPS